MESSAIPIFMNATQDGLTHTGIVTFEGFSEDICTQTIG